MGWPHQLEVFADHGHILLGCALDLGAGAREGLPVGSAPVCQRAVAFAFGGGKSGIDFINGITST